jgi:hypothetical protein
MKIAVWDTYVTRKDGRVMHFDILVEPTVTSEEVIFGYGKQYLQLKNEEGQILSANECQFCHIETASEIIEKQIETFGFSIIEMENCD